MPCTSIATRSPEAVFLSFSLLRLSPLVPVCFCPPRAIFFKATLLLTAALLSSETLPLPLHQFLNLRLEFGARRYQPIWEKVQVWVSTEREVMGGCKVKGRYSERQRACVVWVSLSLLSLSLFLSLSLILCVWLWRFRWLEVSGTPHRHSWEEKKGSSAHVQHSSMFLLVCSALKRPWTNISSQTTMTHWL